MPDAPSPHSERLLAWLNEPPQSGELKADVRNLLEQLEAAKRQRDSLKRESDMYQGCLSAMRGDRDEYDAILERCLSAMRDDRDEYDAILERKLDDLHGLLGQMEALRAMLEELIDAAEYLALYSEGAVGIEELRESQHKARALLDSPASRQEVPNHILGADLTGGSPGSHARVRFIPPPPDPPVS